MYAHLNEIAWWNSGKYNEITLAGKFVTSAIFVESMEK